MTKLNGQPARPFTEEQFFEEAMRTPPRLMRPVAAQAQAIEREGLMEIREKYSSVPDEIFWEIYEFVKRNSRSVN